MYAYLCFIVVAVADAVVVAVADAVAIVVAVVVVGVVVAVVVIVVAVVCAVNAVAVKCCSLLLLLRLLRCGSLANMSGSKKR